MCLLPADILWFSGSLLPKFGGERPCSEMVKSEAADQKVWFEILALTLSSCVMLGKSRNLQGPRFSHL